jgi:NAD(P)H-dependent FMN reductase
MRSRGRIAEEPIWHGAFRVDVVDLAALALPAMDEREHPKLGRYARQHTKDWSGRVNAASAFVLVTTEYNDGFTPPPKNAPDYLCHEWARKPVGFVSYSSGVAAGTGAVQRLKPVALALRMQPVHQAGAVPRVEQHLLPERRFEGGESLRSATRVMLDGIGAMLPTATGARSTM